MGRTRAEEIFKHAMEIEAAGEKFYRTLAGIVADEQLKKLFLIMAAQELQHYETYKALMGNLEEGQKEKDSDEGARNFDEVQYDGLKDKIFNRLETIQKVSGLKSLGGALQAMIDIECDVIDLFERLQHLVRPADRSQIVRVINVERSHVKQLTEIRQQYESVTLK